MPSPRPASGGPPATPSALPRVGLRPGVLWVPFVAALALAALVAWRWWRATSG